MKLEATFRLTSVLLAAIGFLGLIATGGLYPSLVIVGLLALALSVASGAAWAKGTVLEKFGQFSRRIWNIFLIGACLALLVAWALLSMDILTSAVHFLVVLMVTKLFTLRGRKDYLHLYAISFLEVLASAALTQELWYALIFCAYLFVAIWVAPALIGRIPPITLYGRATRERALEALGRSRLYPLRQLLGLLKLTVALCYGADPEVRQAIGYPFQHDDPHRVGGP